MTYVDEEVDENFPDSICNFEPWTFPDPEGMMKRQSKVLDREEQFDLSRFRECLLIFQALCSLEETEDLFSILPGIFSLK